MENTSSNVFLYYRLPTASLTNPVYLEDLKFRNRLLGENHWTSMGFNGIYISITVCVTADQAVVFRLKYPGSTITAY